LHNARRNIKDRLRLNDDLCFGADRNLGDLLNFER
jgi:hypothetical protein